ncbi:MAG: sigma-70 family RNA polymerase sigma factor [Gemmatimonadota bacterium]|nr:sigma-70 family RNA polymerase sigma factor [Gemmatimonadota bacterium]
MTAGSREEFEFDIRVLADPDAEASARNVAWRLVYEHFDPRLRSFFVRRVSTEGDLDALLSEIWRRVLLKIGSLSSSRAAWSWLLTIGVNLLRDQRRDRAAAIRREDHFKIYLKDDPEQTLLDMLTDDPFDGRIDRQIFFQRLQDLPALDRQLVNCFAVEEMSHKEIALRLGLASPEASRQRLVHIRKVLRGEE